MIDKILERLKSPLKDEGWIVKVIIGGLLSYIPVLGWAPVFGYLSDRVSQDDREKLPVWGNIEKLFMDGLPTALMLTVLMIIFSIVHVILNSIFCVGTILSIIISLGVGFLLPAVIVAFILELKNKGDWKTALNIQGLIDIIKNKFDDLKVELLIFFVVSLIAVFVGCCGILAPFTLFYVALVYYPVLADILKGESKDVAAPAEEIKEEAKEESKEETVEAEKTEEEEPVEESKDETAGEDDSKKE